VLETPAAPKFSLRRQQLVAPFFVNNPEDDNMIFPPVRITNHLRCDCGRVIKDRDLETGDSRVRLICPACHQDLLEIELIEDGDDED
jgi:hypothetical protein